MSEVIIWCHCLEGSGARRCQFGVIVWKDQVVAGVSGFQLMGQLVSEGSVCNDAITYVGWCNNYNYFVSVA